MSDVEFQPGANDGQKTCDTQPFRVVVGAEDFPNGHRSFGTYSSLAVGEHNPPAPTIFAVNPILHSSGLASNPWTNHNGPLLALLADTLDDLERTRIANENRLRQLTRTGPDADGEERGFGLTLDMPQVASLAGIVDAIGKLEHDATLNLQRALRKHPLGPWVKATVGIGEKQGARLIAAIGDPYWHTLHDRPRTVSELWAYCGLRVIDGQAPARARGQRANWSATAKMRAHLVAKSCIKQAHSPYRKVYDDAREQYADALHPADCRRCGPSGNPATKGSPLSAGHQDARALRRVSKEVLKDLWRESKRLHESTN